MSVDPLAEEFPGWNPYHYVHNNPVNLIDPTGMSAEQTGEGNPKKQPSLLESTFEGISSTLDEIVISAKKSGFSSEKISSDWEKNKEKSGYNHFKRESEKMYEQINSLGGYLIYGNGGENMTGGHNIEGDHKVIDSGVMGGVGAGVDTKKNSILGLIRYLVGAFGNFTNDRKKYTKVRENNDTIWVRSPNRVGRMGTGYILKSEQNDKN